jgi:predicted MFS family arabinose efflux permease
LPDEAEAGGGLMVAVVQLAITGGAAFGGLLFDRGGYQTTFMFSALMFGACAAAAFLSARGDRSASIRSTEQPRAAAA